MKLLAVVLSSCVLVACGGGGGSSAPTTSTSTSTLLTVTGTAATGLAIPGATINGKCKVGSSTATTLPDGSYTLAVTDGQLPCVLQITNPVDGVKLHTVVTGTGSTANANITPLTEMATARVLGSEPNVFFAAFDAAVATQKITANTVQAAQTDIGLVLTDTVETSSLGNFISAPLKAATQGSPTSGDAHDKLLDALKLKLSSAQVGTLATAFASNQTNDAIKQTVTTMKGGGTSAAVAPLANAGAEQSVLKGATVTLDASTSSAAAGKTLSYAWTLNLKPAGSVATLAAPTTAKPTFVADVAGSYFASVIVNDGTTASSAAVSVTTTVFTSVGINPLPIGSGIFSATPYSLDLFNYTTSKGTFYNIDGSGFLNKQPTKLSCAQYDAADIKPDGRVLAVRNSVDEIDIISGLCNYLFAVPEAMKAIAIDKDGYIFMISSNMSFGKYQLYQFTEHGVQIGKVFLTEESSTGIGSFSPMIDAIDFSPDGSLYGFGVSGVFKINKTTGISNLINSNISIISKDVDIDSNGTLRYLGKINGTETIELVSTLTWKSVGSITLEKNIFGIPYSYSWTNGVLVYR